MIRALPVALLLSLLLVPTAAEAGRRHPIRIICPRTQPHELDRFAEVFEATLDGIEVRRPGGQASEARSFHYRFAIQRRFKGRRRGVVEVEAGFGTAPFEPVGERYLVFLSRSEKKELFLYTCGLVMGPGVERWLRDHPSPGVDLAHHLKAKRRRGSSPELATLEGRREGPAWVEHLRRRYRLELYDLREALSRGEAEAAFQLWRRVQQGIARLIPAAARASGRAEHREPPADPEPELSQELFVQLDREARLALVELEPARARARWSEVLMVSPRSEKARAGLAQLDEEAGRIFQQAHENRESHPVLSRAGLRQVTLMTSASSSLHQRARRLLAELETSEKEAR